MARALREAFDGQAIVLTPDLPLHPKEALKYIRMLIDKEKPDLLIGNSCGAFLAQMLSPVVGIPALLGNPHFKITNFLRERIGGLNEQREQSIACSGYAESREKKTEGQLCGEEDLMMVISRMILHLEAGLVFARKAMAEIEETMTNGSSDDDTTESAEEIVTEEIADDDNNE